MATVAATSAATPMWRCLRIWPLISFDDAIMMIFVRYRRGRRSSSFSSLSALSPSLHFILIHMYLYGHRDTDLRDLFLSLFSSSFCFLL